jgi:hypothetical protein
MPTSIKKCSASSLIMILIKTSYADSCAACLTSMQSPLMKFT